MNSTTACTLCFCPRYDPVDRMTGPLASMVKDKPCKICQHRGSDHTKTVGNPDALTDDVPAGKTDTSKAAFESIKGHKRNDAQNKVLAQIEMRPETGATNEELVAYTGLTLQSVTARANELMRFGLIEDSGRRRENRSGRKAKVWVPSKETA